MTSLHELVTSTGLMPEVTGEATVPPTAEPPSRPSVAGALMGALGRGGFTHCFGIPGRHVQSLFHALPASGLTPIVTRHEQGAVFMADGFARAAGHPAVVVATAGPGAGNMVTAVANAFAEGTPVLCLAGASPRRFAGRGAFQELGDDHSALTDAVFAPLTRYHAQLAHPAQLGPSLRLAAAAAAEGGPAVLTLPTDVLDAPSGAGLPPVTGTPRLLTPSPVDVEAAAALLAAHPNALILAGRGAMRAGDALTRLAERLQIPVVTTLHGRGGIDEDHPLALGPQGFGASRWAEHWLRDHVPDVVLAVGTRLREISTNVYDPNFQGRVALIHVTADARALGRHYQPTVGAAADPGLFLEALLEQVPARAPNEALAAWKAATPRFDEAPADAPGAIAPRRVVEALRRALGKTDVLVADTGNAVPWSVRHYPVHAPGTYMVAMHLAAMGWGTCAAIGVQLARPEARVAALVGDGCFQMAGMEIATAVQYNLPVVWVVLNDARYNMVFQGSTGFYGQAVPNCELSPVDCAKVAEGLGAAGFRVDDPALLDATIAAALACGRPAVVDVAIDPEVRPPMAGRFDALKVSEERVS